MNVEKEIGNRNIKYIEVDGERIALKKSGKNWRVTYPLKNEDGTFNWKNLLKVNWVTLFLTIAIILLTFWATKNVNTLLDCFSSIDKLEVCKQIYGQGNLNIITNPFS